MSNEKRKDPSGKTRREGERTLLDEKSGELLVDVLVQVDPVAADAGLAGKSELAGDET